MTMKIFKAEPIESRINERPWDGSTHKGWVIVRAENERNVIHILSSEFGIAARLRSGEDTPKNPWRAGLANYTEMTDEEIESSEYSIEGEEGIIEKEGDALEGRH